MFFGPFRPFRAEGYDDDYESYTAWRLRSLLHDDIRHPRGEGSNAME